MWFDALNLWASVTQVSRLQIGMQNATAGRTAFAGQPPSPQLTATLRNAIASFSGSAAAKELALLFKGDGAGSAQLWRRAPPL